MPRKEAYQTGGQVQALTAAGRRQVGFADGRLNQEKLTPVGDQAWQRDAWRFFDTIGEFEFAANWVGGLLSRAKLRVHKDGKDVKDGDSAAEYMRMFFGTDAGRSQMLKSVGIHRTVAGENYWISYEGPDGNDVWEVAAPSSVKKVGSSWEINGVQVKLKDNKDPLRIRGWNPHPLKPELANSPSRAALPILAEIERLTMHVAAQVDSRLTSAGILLIPNEMSFAADADGSDGKVSSNSGTRRFIEALGSVFATAIKDRASAAANVPIILSADGEILKNVKHLKFWSGLDEHAMALRSEAIRRLALSMDMPPEILLGTGDSNHWASWSVDESAIKSHTEPLLFGICSDITNGYLRPILEEDGMDHKEAMSYEVFADTSELRLRPNRSKEAMELYDRGKLSGSALLRETGFDPDTDIPDDEEQKLFFIRKLASGSATPEMVAEGLRLLGVKIESKGIKVNEARPTPSLIEHPETGPPDMDESEARAERRARKAALVAASEQIVFRALERCGNKMATQLKLSAPKGAAPSEAYLFHVVPEDKIDFVFEGSFSHAERFSDDYDMDSEVWASTLGEYCRNLVSKQKRHTKAGLTKALERLELTHV